MSWCVNERVSHIVSCCVFLGNTQSLSTMPLATMLWFGQSPLLFEPPLGAQRLLIPVSVSRIVSFCVLELFNTVLILFSFTLPAFLLVCGENVGDETTPWFRIWDGCGRVFVLGGPPKMVGGPCVSFVPFFGFDSNLFAPRHCFCHSRCGSSPGRPRQWDAKKNHAMGWASKKCHGSEA